MSNLECPVCKSDEISIRESFSTEKIIKLYKNDFKTDAQKFFKNKTVINLYSCGRCTYSFFAPENLNDEASLLGQIQELCGDSGFYEELQKFSWYYDPWKWEHKIAKSLISKDEKVLEIGCGEGSFLEGISDITNNSSGIELNEKVIESCQSKGLDVVKMFIEEYSLINKDKFDWVCDFQVLEHVSNPYTFIKGSVDSLKKGGKMLVCVPNNDCFLRDAKNNVLNMPPHHVGRWNKKSLENLSNVFDIKISKVLIEPLQYYHFPTYTKIKVQKFLKLNDFFSRALAALILPISSIFLYLLRNKIVGLSILLVFEKK